MILALGFSLGVVYLVCRSHRQITDAEASRRGFDVRGAIDRAKRLLRDVGARDMQ